MKKLVKPDKLSVSVQGIRKTRTKDLLVKLECSKEDRGWLDSTLKEVMGKNGSVRSVVPRIEDIEEAVRGFFDYGSVPGLKVPLTKKPFKGNKKAHV